MEVPLELFYGEAYNIKEYLPALWEKDANICVRILFYLRDHRSQGIIQGRGMRRPFQEGLAWIAENQPEAGASILCHVPRFGYWKDLLVLLGSPLEKDVISLFARQLRDDMETMKSGGIPSMAAKWTPTEGTHYDRLHGITHKIANELEVSKKRLRQQFLVPLRKYLGVAEQRMCAKEWSLVDYERIPCISFERYTKSFLRHDKERFASYMRSSTRGTIVERWRKHLPPLISFVEAALRGEEPPLELWTENLPMHINRKLICAVDTSGSMLIFPQLCALTIVLSIAAVTGQRKWINFDGSLQELPEGPVSLQAQSIAALQCNSSLDLINTASIAASAGADKLLVLTDYPPCDWENEDLGSMEILYWAIDTTRPIIQKVNNLVSLEGFDNFLFNQVIRGNSPTPEYYVLAALSDPRYATLKVEYPLIAEETTIRRE